MQRDVGVPQVNAGRVEGTQEGGKERRES